MQFKLNITQYKGIQLITTNSEQLEYCRNGRSDINELPPTLGGCFFGLLFFWGHLVFYLFGPLDSVYYLDQLDFKLFYLSFQFLMKNSAS